jgi:hypothetical protein
VIVASLVLILAAAVLLVVGLVRDSDVLLVVSIALSLVAAVALYLGARQSSAARTAPNGPAEDEDGGGTAAESPASPAGGGFRSSALRQERPDWPLPPGAPAGAAADTATGRPPPLRGAESVAGQPATAAPNSAANGVADQQVADELPPDEDPSDEPPAQHTPREDAALIARLPAEVLVVDGRPRYHVTGCRHLSEREYEPLPVAEAVELGFTPCGWCQPDTVLLGGTPRA